MKIIVALVVIAALVVVLSGRLGPSRTEDTNQPPADDPRGDRPRDD